MRLIGLSIAKGQEALRIGQEALHAAAALQRESADLKARAYALAPWLVNDRVADRRPNGTGAQP